MNLGALRQSPRKMVIALMIVLLVAAGIYYIIKYKPLADLLSQTASSVASGNWSSTSTWSNGRVPDENDVVTIKTGHTVTSDKIVDLAAGNITVESGAALDTGAYDFKVADVTIHGTLNANASQLTIGGLITGTGTVDFSSAGVEFTAVNTNNTVTVPGTTYYNLKVSSADKSFLAGGNIEVKNNFTVATGSKFDANGRTITLNNSDSASTAAKNTKPEAVLAQSSSDFTINVDAAVKNRGGEKINPLIYGLAERADPPFLKDLGTTSVRHGGNHVTRFNWETGYDNGGADLGPFQNGTSRMWNLGGKSMMRGYLDANKQAGATSALTVNTIGWVAKNSTAKGGDTSVNSNLAIPSYSVYEPDPNTCPDCIKAYNPTYNQDHTSIPSKLRKSSSLSLTPDLNDGVVYQDEYVNFIRNYRQSNGIENIIWIMDNEYDLWKETHKDIKPQWITPTAVVSMMKEFGDMVKDIDPNAITFAPATAMYNHIMFNEKACDNNGSWTVNYPCTYSIQENKPFHQYLLAKMKEYDDQTGRRIIDYLTQHYYPQDPAGSVYCGPGAGTGTANLRGTDACSNAFRLRSIRSLWDQNYIEESWLKDSNNGKPLALIPTLEKWVSESYPGTKIGINEWNWAEGGDNPARNTMSTGLATAEVLGVFGREGMDAANFWSYPDSGSPAYFAFKLYGNPDGDGSTQGADKFGDISIKSTTANSPTNLSDGSACKTDSTYRGDCIVSSYAALDDTGKLTMVLINKDPKNTASTAVNISNYAIDTSKAATIYQYKDPSATSLTKTSVVPASTSGFNISLPAYSMSLVVFNGGSSGGDDGGDTGGGTTASATAYQDCWYGGYSAQLPPGEYTASRLSALGVLDNDLSSLKVPSGLTVTLYQSDNFGGATLVKTADDDCLVDDGWNDYVSSIKVVSSTSGGTTDPKSTLLASTDTPLNIETGAAFNASNSIINYAGVRSNSTVKVTGGIYHTLGLMGAETYDLTGGVKVVGNLNIASGSTLSAGSNTITLAGVNSQFTNNGSFSAGTGTVMFDGLDNAIQIISGNNTFNNLTVASGVNAGRTLQFKGGTVQTINGTFTSSGSSGKMVALKSTDTNTWQIKPAKANVNHSDISNSVNNGADFCATYSVDSGNNTGWKISETDTCSTSTITKPVTIYYGCDYLRTYADLEVKSYTMTDLQNMGFANDALSAIKVADGYRAILYEHDNFGGGSITLTADDSCLENEGWSDRMSSMKVEAVSGTDPTDTQNPSASITSPSSGATVTLPFNVVVEATDNVGVSSVALNIDGVASNITPTVSGSSYTFSVSSSHISIGNRNLTATAKDAAGNSATTSGIGVSVTSGDDTVSKVTFYSECYYGGNPKTVDVGAYRTRDLNKLGISNDDLSSLKVPSGYRVTLYTDDRYRGASLVKTDNDDCLIDDGFNDRISSLKVEKQ